MDRDLELGDGMTIAGSEIDWTFSTSGGPGGQHANKASSRAEARLDLLRSPSLLLHSSVQAKLQNRFGETVSATADDDRSQARNRAIAVDRLEAKLREALVTKKRRRKTRPSRGAKRRRLEKKRQRSDLKQQRKRPKW